MMPVPSVDTQVELGGSAQVLVSSVHVVPLAQTAVPHVQAPELTAEASVLPQAGGASAQAYASCVE